MECSESDHELLLNIANIVAEQKKEVLQLVDEGLLAEAKHVLKVLWPLWLSTGFSYNYSELMDIIGRKEGK